MRKVVKEQGAKIFRSKGIFSFDSSEKRYVFQGVHMVMDSQWGLPWKADEERNSRLVFIGRGLNRAELEAGFQSCRAKVAA